MKPRVGNSPTPWRASGRLRVSSVSGAAVASHRSAGNGQSVWSHRLEQGFVLLPYAVRLAALPEYQRHRATVNRSIVS
jgi:hypothetical protein